MDHEPDPKVTEALAELVDATDIPSAARAITAKDPDTAAVLVEFAIRASAAGNSHK